MVEKYVCMYVLNTIIHVLFGYCMVKSYFQCICVEQNNDNINFLASVYKPPKRNIPNSQWFLSTIKFY